MAKGAGNRMWRALVLTLCVVHNQVSPESSFILSLNIHTGIKLMPATKKTGSSSNVQN